MVGRWVLSMAVLVPPERLGELAPGVLLGWEYGK